MHTHTHTFQATVCPLSGMFAFDGVSLPMHVFIRKEIQIVNSITQDTHVFICYISMSSHPSHFITLPHTSSHSLTLHHTPSHFITLPHTSSHSLTLHHTPSHFITLPHTSSHSLTLHHTPSHFITLPHTSSHSLTLHHTPSHFITLPHTSSHSLTHITCMYTHTHTSTPINMYRGSSVFHPSASLLLHHIACQLLNIDTLVSYLLCEWHLVVSWNPATIPASSPSGSATCQAPSHPVLACSSVLGN